MKAALEEQGFKPKFLIEIKHILITIAIMELNLKEPTNQGVHTSKGLNFLL